MTQSDSAAPAAAPRALALELLTDAASDQRHCYRFAGRWLLVDAGLPSLEPFAAVPPDGVALPRPRRGPLAQPAGAFYRGPGWVGGRMAEVSCERAGDTYVVRVEGLPALHVTRAGCEVVPRVGSESVDGTLIEALLGPGLILALALDGVFTLHASAVEVEGSAVLLLGESGAGKSTLARALGASPGCGQLADDVLPAVIAGDRVDALPHYPQLKLPARLQYAAGRPERVPIRAVYELRGAAGVAEPVAVEPVSPRDATVMLAAHTVAARLFDAALLERHLAFCAAAAASLPMRRLRFTRRLEHLPAIVAAIRADLAAGR